MHESIITKSVSRFARNTAECIEFVRLLRQMGIGVIFEEQNIDTLKCDTELLMTIHASFAQAESESMSRNITWSYRKRFENGAVMFNYSRILGYRKGADGQPEIVPEEAEIVRSIFDMFLSGMTLREISAYLQVEGIKTKGGSTTWSIATVQNILKNEKYCGDAITQKTITVDCISKIRKKNTGEAPMYYVRDNHAAIVDRKTYNRVQTEMARRNSKRSPSDKATITGQGRHSRYALSDIMHCGEFTYRVPYDYTTMTEGVVAVEKRYYYSTVTIIPAANIYYEDNFFTFTNSTAMDGNIGKWIPGGSIGNETQAEDRPGTDSKFEIDADNVYGYDSVNGFYEEYSLDTYHKVSVNEATGKPATAPKVQFTFTGTGFDLISLTNSDSGLITVEVYGPLNHSEKEPETKKLVVDNYYGYTYSDGKWNVDQDASDCLYQVPVIKVDDLTYGTYNVTVRVAYMAMFDHQDDDSYSFWMDAVRIYNPVDTGSNNTVKDAYEKDQESNPCFEMLRDILVGAKTFHADGSTGAVFIDGKLNNGASVSEYQNFGPNNEVYLAGGQTIAFKLVTNTNPTNIQTVQIGAKLAKGSNAKLYYGTKELVTLNTATNMFYKLDNVSWKETVKGEQWTSSTIVLTHNAASATTQNIISLTDVKITSKVPITLKTKTAVAATELLNNAEGPAIILYADGQTVEYAAAVMNAIESESDDITGEEPDSVPVALTGKSFSLSFENQVLVNFYYTVSDMIDVAEHGMLVFYSDPGTVDIANADMVYNEPVYVESLGCYMATTEGIAAKEMGDTRYYVAYAKLTDGSYVYSAAYDYSPKKYSMNMLGKESTSDKQKALCVAMLNYGAAAQEYFGYNTDSLMNAELTAEQQALVVAFDAGLFTGAVAADASKTGNFTKTSTGFFGKSATVSFDGAFCVNYYFTPSTTVNGDMMLYIWTPDVYAEAETLTAENAEIMTMVAGSDGGYWGQVSGIAAKNLDDTYYVAGVYTDADGNTYCTGVIAYSLSRYCLNKAVDGNEMQELAYATAMYGYYAKCYFAA